MDLGLRDKSVIVTGGTRGIGRAIALGFAAEGARVTINARSADALPTTLDALARAGGGPHRAIAADVMTPEGVEKTIAAAIAQNGGVDVLVNNVGGSGARHFDDADETDFVTTFDKNFWPALRMSRGVLASMRSRGGGAIVHIASIWGREGGGAPAYNVAKAAEMSLAKAMARDLAKDAIRVNTVAPGSIMFEGGGWDRRQKADPNGIAAFIERELPFGRMGQPEEVARVVVFVCSSAASWMTGACVPVDGGQGHAF